MKDFWDKRYSGEIFAYGTDPNIYFKEKLSTVAPVGKLLLPAEGEGRNAVYAAQAGWQVTCFDFSSAGRRKALELAKLKGVQINYLTAGIEDISLPDNYFDGMALIYAHFNATNRLLHHQKLLKKVKKGGIVIFEAYAKEQLHYQKEFNSGGPKEEAMLFSLEEVKKEFEGIAFIALQQLEINIHEGEYHNGLSAVIRFTGTKL